MLERQLGESPAGTLMDLLPPAGWADVARQSDLVAVRGEIALLRGEMGELRGELKGAMAGIRGEIAMLSARVDARIPPFVWANVPLAFGVAGLVLAAAKLA